jgi:glycosyltransferase involved in cell wall biosynthesis
LLHAGSDAGFPVARECDLSPQSQGVAREIDPSEAEHRIAALDPAVPTAPVSVVIAAYNADETIAATLLSIHRQSLRPAEIVVIDDGSTDRTAAIARALGARVVGAPHRGVSAARNLGIAAAAQDWIAFIDADDLWFPEKLARQWDLVTRYPAYRFTAANVVRLYDSGKLDLLPQREISAFLQMSVRELETNLYHYDCDNFMAPFYLHVVTVMAHRSLLRKAGPFNESLPACEDTELWLRMLALEPLLLLDEPQSWYRRHTRSVTFADPIIADLSHLKLTDMVRAHPARYPSDTKRYFAETVPWIALQTGHYAVRVGRFEEAAEPLRRSLRHRFHWQPGLMYAALPVLRLRPVRWAFGRVRAAWKARPRARLKGSEVG